ncbi:MAG: peptidase inhibitor I78 [Caulobacter sp.]|jgi:hypothetical protein|nr:peptidase inhibitor I78 [Caulobacter sp.]
MIRKLATLAAVLTLSACASAPEPSKGPTMAPPVSQAPTEPVPDLPPPDSCKAKDFQYLVGRNKSEIPVPTDPSKRRVACTSCPVTMDYRPDRLNIYFDADTGIVKEVKCG